MKHFARAARLALVVGLGLVPHVASAQGAFSDTSLSGTIDLAATYPGDLRIDCTKIVVTARAALGPPISVTATPIADSTRACAFRFARIARMTYTIATNPFSIAAYVGATPAIVQATATAEVRIPIAGNAPALIVSIRPSGPLPTPTPAPAAAVLTVTAGGAQTRQCDPRLSMGAYNDFLNPLALRLTTLAGTPIANAPIVFSCPPDVYYRNCSLRQDFMNGVTKSVTVTTDANGMATLSPVNNVTVAVLYAYTSALPDGSMPPMPVTATYKNVSAVFTMTLVKATNLPGMH